MKAVNLLLVFIALGVIRSFATGVGVLDSEKGLYLNLMKTYTKVEVENQVAVVTTKQTFKNTQNSDVNITYVYPLPASASASNLEWTIDGGLYRARISATPQDTTLPGPGGDTHLNLKKYIGETPLYFSIEQPVKADSTIEIALTYVQLLPYSNGDVSFTCPNDYRLIQNSAIAIQDFEMVLKSARKIESVTMLSSHPVTDFTNNGNQAVLKSRVTNSALDEDYNLIYTQNSSELGLFGLSTKIPNEELPDDFGGFFLFVVEPDPSGTTEVIDKVFTLVMDRSGSMESEDRLVQAKNAAGFIINNLNEGDEFNIVDFARYATSFRETHVPFTEANKAAALDYINQLEPTWTTELSGTNISAAFDKAIPQFSSSDEKTANIIIFFTDGEATWGVLEPPAICEHVQNLVQQNNAKLAIHAFGLGNGINVQLLTRLANENGGISEFLGDDEVEERIKSFYLKIRYPVLLEPQMSFSPNVVHETFPTKLQSLYIGQQMLVSGRYTQSGPVKVTLSGKAFGKPVQYNYQLNLADTADERYQFLPKVWAKQKIEELLVAYNSLNPYSQEAIVIKNQIIEFSIAYGVITQFTSFQEPATGVANDVREATEDLPSHFELLNNYPNPFNPSTHIRFQVNIRMQQLVKVRIYNTLGQLVQVLVVNVNEPGVYETLWDGTDLMGNPVPSGTYLYIIDFGEALLSGKMQLLK